MGDDINDFLKQILDEKENEEPIERRIQNNNNLINTAKDWKMGSTGRKIHKEMCKMTEKRKEETRTLNKAAAAAQRSRAL